jgi:ABC-type glutathione transport system ATPase component
MFLKYPSSISQPHRDFYYSSSFSQLASDESQLQACRSILENPLTILCGRGGTGKTKIVTTVLGEVRKVLIEKGFLLMEDDITDEKMKEKNSQDIDFHLQQQIGSLVLGDTIEDEDTDIFATDGEGDNDDDDDVFGDDHGDDELNELDLDKLERESEEKTKDLWEEYSQKLGGLV